MLGLVAVVASSFIAACSDDKKTDDGAGLPDRTGKDGGTEAAPGTDSSAPLDCTKRAGKVSDTPACDTCVKANCCEQITACDKADDCAALEQCLDDCAPGDGVCPLACQAIHDKGAQVLQDVGACAQAKCKKECPIQIPDAGGDAPF